MSNNTNVQKIASVGIAALTVSGQTVMAITRAPDGSFGWRSHGKLVVKAKDGMNKAAYKFKKGFDKFETAVAAAIVYLRRHHDVTDGDIGIADYVAPERTGLPTRRMVDSPEFLAASKLASKLKLPKGVQAALTPVAAPAAAPAKAAPAAPAQKAKKSA